MAFINDGPGGNFIPGTNVFDDIFGNGGDDRIMGGLGPDHLHGGSGTDTAIYVDSAVGVTVALANAGFGTGLGGTAQGDLLDSIENVTGSAFGDTITGNGGANVLDGLGGNDILDGSGGNDTLNGGAGFDRLLGGAGTDTLFGGADADFLDGGIGADAMDGGAGNDTYVFGGLGDTISEVGGSGIDTVLSAVSFDLTGGAVADDVENVVLTGSGDVDATGNALANTLRGNAGDNELDGGLGSDLMIGAGGSDTYVVNSGGDVVDESTPGASGADLVISSVTFNLRGAQVAGTQDAVENLVLTGNAAIGGFGNDLDNILVGNAGANSLMGLAGNDTLMGGGGADTFMFHAPLNAATNVDAIIDFDVTQDLMRLENGFMAGLAMGALSAGAFHVGAAAQDASDRIVYDAVNGDLLFDADGTGAAAAVLFAELDIGLALSNADFFVV